MNSPLLHRYLLIQALLFLCCSVAHGTIDDERVFYTFNASNGLADNSAQAIKCTRTGRMVISTIGHINFYDGDTFVHVDPKSEDSYPLPAYDGHYHLYFDRHHHLWVKDKRSVTVVNLLQEMFEHDVARVIRDMGHQQKVDDLFGDSRSHIWFLSSGTLHGIDDHCRVTVRNDAILQDLDVYCDSLLLQFYDDGGVRANVLSSGRQVFDVSVSDNDEAVRYNSSSVIMVDGNYYYQIRNGKTEGLLRRFDIHKLQWETLMRTPYHLNNMEMYNGLLYVASEYGYWTYDVSTGQQYHYEVLTLTEGVTLKTNINTLAFDRQGGLWIGTEKRGLLYSKSIPSPFKSYHWDTPEARQYMALLDARLAKADTNLERHVNCRFTDSRGWVWTGKYTGLTVEKPGEKKIRKYTTSDGLRNEMIHCIIEDNDHDIWVGTSYGISHLYIRNGNVSKIETYSLYDNVPNESFVNGRVAKLDDGTIIMQSLDHIVTFNPTMFRPDRFRQMRLYPKLIRLMVNGHEMHAGSVLNGDTVIDRAVSRIRELNLNYDMNTLIMTFSGLNFVRPVQTYYRVRVTGLSDWKVYSLANSHGRVNARGLFRLQLPALLPGRYEVQMQVSMDPDEWATEPVAWFININEPWWRSTGIYILLALVLTTLVLGNFWLYNRRTRLSLIAHHREEEIMYRIRPMLREIFHRDISLRELSKFSGLDMRTLCKHLSENLYKSPQQLKEKLLRDATFDR